MHRTEVKSSQIHAIGYDPATEKMEVEFTTWQPSKPRAVYEFSNVTPEQHAEFMAAGSKGSHFNQTFKTDAKRWPYRRMEPEVQNDGPAVA